MSDQRCCAEGPRWFGYLHVRIGSAPIAGTAMMLVGHKFKKFLQVGQDGHSLNFSAIAAFVGQLKGHCDLRVSAIGRVEVEFCFRAGARDCARSAGTNIFQVWALAARKGGVTFSGSAAGEGWGRNGEPRGSSTPPANKAEMRAIVQLTGNWVKYGRAPALVQLKHIALQSGGACPVLACDESELVTREEADCQPSLSVGDWEMRGEPHAQMLKAGKEAFGKKRIAGPLGNLRSLFKHFP